MVKNYLAGVLAANPNEALKIDDNTRAEIVNRLERAKEALNNFDQMQESIDALTEEPENTIEYRELFEGEYFALLNTGRKLLVRGVPAEVANLAQPSVRVVDRQLTTANPDDENSRNNNTRAVRLPTIDLPKFNGDLADWICFRDTFESLIHKNESISNIQKFHYLKAALHDVAAQVVNSLEFSSANYIVAWSALCDRFNSTKLLVHNHIKSIFEIKAMKNESAAEIQIILDAMLKHVRALNILGVLTDNWDSILIYIITSKFESLTARAWEQEKSRIETPKFKDVRDFLFARSQFLQTLEVNRQAVASNSSINRRQIKTRAFLTTEKGAKCAICQQTHYIQNCSKFLLLNTRAKADKIRECKLCLNCLRPGHSFSDCKSGSCKKCNGKHNTLIHHNKSEKGESVVNLCANNLNVWNVILATALISVEDESGHLMGARMALDSCSQSNFVSEELCDALMLRRIPVNIGVDGLNNCEVHAKHKCEVVLSAHHNSFRIKISCLVIPSITGLMPSAGIDLRGIKIPPHLRLADPSFHTPGKIDLLLGAEWFWRILCVGQFALGDAGLIMQKTKLGWVIAGPTGPMISLSLQCHLSRQVTSAIEKKLQNFWEIEELPNVKPLSQEEKQCEAIFVKTVQRDANGRFIVDIPFKENPSKLGDSRHLAER